MTKKQAQAAPPPAVPQEIKMSPQRAAMAQPWIERAKARLLGRRIIGIRWMGEGELENLAWPQGSMVLELDDGSLLLPQADDEGNGPGAVLHITKTDDMLFGVI